MLLMTVIAGIYETFYTNICYLYEKKIHVKLYFQNWHFAVNLFCSSGLVTLISEMIKHTPFH